MPSALVVVVTGPSITVGVGFGVDLGAGEGIAVGEVVAIGVTGVAVAEAAAICSLVADGDGTTVGIAVTFADAVQPSIARNTALIKRQRVARLRMTRHPF